MIIIRDNTDTDVDTVPGDPIVSDAKTLYEFKPLYMRLTFWHLFGSHRMLDLSAAFDTVEHSMLLSRLSTSFGIRGTALEWFVLVTYCDVFSVFR